MTSLAKRAKRRQHIWLLTRSPSRVGAPRIGIQQEGRAGDLRKLLRLAFGCALVELDEAELRSAAHGLALG
jgi:hypothetical protein